MIKSSAVPDSDIRSQAIHWISRVRSGDCSDSERQALDDWLRRDERHRQEYDRVQKWLDDVRKTAPDIFPEVEEARRLRALPRPRLLAIAACFMLMAIGGAWFFVASQSIETYHTEKGERISVTLADWSQITLNTDTELELRASWFSRQITLKRGEALFTVAHGTGMPFEVIAAGGTIRDLGTRFNVRRESDAVSVAVVEGRVAVWTDNEHDARLLGANEQVSYDASGEISPTTKINAESLTAWSVGRILFKRTPLIKIFDEMARYHNVRIEVADARVNAISVNGTFRVVDADGLLHAIETLFPVRFERLPEQGETRRYRALYQPGNLVSR